MFFGWVGKARALGLSRQERFDRVLPLSRCFRLCCSWDAMTSKLKPTAVVLAGWHVHKGSRVSQNPGLHLTGNRSRYSSEYISFF
jgi:hypothetical protein